MHVVAVNHSRLDREGDFHSDLKLEDYFMRSKHALFLVIIASSFKYCTYIISQRPNTNQSSRFEELLSRVSEYSAANAQHAKLY